MTDRPFSFRPWIFGRSARSAALAPTKRKSRPAARAAFPLVPHLPVGVVVSPEPLLPPPMEPPDVGPLCIDRDLEWRVEDFPAGAWDCSSLWRRWVVVEFDEPVDVLGDIVVDDDPDVPPDDDWANAVPAIIRAAAAVTISTRIGNSSSGWSRVHYGASNSTGSRATLFHGMRRRQMPTVRLGTSGLRIGRGFCGADGT